MGKFKIDDVTFLQQVGSPAKRDASDGTSFVLVKTDAMLDFYRSLKVHKPRDIMEIGMFEGGSMVFFDKLFEPTKLVGVDARPNPIEPLEQYRKDKPHIETYYSRFQDKPGTRAAAQKNFSSGIDLVVDDASHLYHETKGTFNMLFPMVREGGHYVIEDWSWSHQRPHQAPDAFSANRKALSDLVFELVIMSSQVAVIESVLVNRHLICVQKGRGMFTPELFDLSNCLRGRELIEV